MLTQPPAPVYSTSELLRDKHARAHRTRPEITDGFGADKRNSCIGTAGAEHCSWKRVSAFTPGAPRSSVPLTSCVSPASLRLTKC